jgi:hypothetical protein
VMTARSAGTCAAALIARNSWCDQHLDAEPILGDGMFLT